MISELKPNDRFKAMAAEAYADPIYGQRWEDTLRMVAHVDPKTIRRWLAKPESMPEAIWTMVTAHLRLRRLGYDPLTGNKLGA